MYNVYLAVKRKTGTIIDDLEKKKQEKSKKKNRDEEKKEKLQMQVLKKEWDG